MIFTFISFRLFYFVDYITKLNYLIKTENTINNHIIQIAILFSYFSIKVLFD